MSKLVVGELVNDFFTKFSQAKSIQENESKLSDAIGSLTMNDGTITQEDDNTENVLIGLSVIGPGAAAKRALKAFSS
jgi:hypothetical protein